MKVLVIGITGMLGSMVYDYLTRNNSLVVAGTIRNKKFRKIFNGENIFEFEVQNNESKFALKKILHSFKPDYVINCTGIIKPFCKDSDQKGTKSAIEVNALFPHNLSETLLEFDDKIKLIQIATDCVYSGKNGRYNEMDPHDPIDVYGKTKSLGEVKLRNTLNLRCSIVGPEIKNGLSLLCWFLQNKNRSNVEGYAHHFWNGLTTLQFAQYCENIIVGNEFQKLRNINHTIHLVLNETVSKYELLCIFKNVFNRNVEIKRKYVESEIVDRSLSSLFRDNGEMKMSIAINELKKYIDNSELFRKELNR